MFGLDQDQTLRLLYLVLLLCFIVVFGARRRRLSASVQQLGIWFLIIAVVLVVYAYRGPILGFFDPVLRELFPSRVVEVVNLEGGRELVVGRGPDGHFHLDAQVNGVSVRFLVDTGATATVLSHADAERAGVHLDELQFDRPVMTANGLAYFARARLASLEIGPFRMSDVAVGVMPPDTLSVSLLGMSTINLFRGWRVEDDRLILSP
jgi:aspartyl protease family protein